MTVRALLLSFALAASVLGCADKEATPAQSSAPAPAFSALVDPNTADAAMLGAVPGLSGDAIKAVLTQRPFATPTQLHDAIKDSVTAEDLDQIYRSMFVKIELNTASEADMKLIPNTLKAGKLAHEFEEYRPYSSMEQFRREIGKYVDANELSRLERYVTLTP